MFPAKAEHNMMMVSSSIAANQSRPAGQSADPYTRKIKENTGATEQNNRSVLMQGLSHQTAPEKLLKALPNYMKPGRTRQAHVTDLLFVAF